MWGTLDISGFHGLSDQGTFVFIKGGRVQCGSWKYDPTVKDLFDWYVVEFLTSSIPTTTTMPWSKIVTWEWVRAEIRSQTEDRVCLYPLWDADAGISRDDLHNFFINNEEANK